MAPRLPLAYPAGLNPGFNQTHITYKKGKVYFSGLPNGGEFVNIVTATGPSSSANKVFAQNLTGPSLLCNGTEFLNFSPEPTAATTKGTIAGIFTTTSTADQCIFDSDSGGAGVSLFNHFSGPVMVRLGASNYSSAISLSINVPYFVIASAFASGSVNLLVMRLDTGQIVTDTQATAADTLTSNGTYLVGKWGGGGFNFNGNINALMYSEGYLELADMALWAKDPWAFWYPRRAPNLVGVVASTMPFFQTDLPPIGRVRQVSIADKSVSLNPNIFTNPFPIMPTDRLPNFRVPLALPQPPVSLNLNLFKNPIPIFNGDGSSSKNIPDWLPPPVPPLNINLFKNPIPFLNPTGQSSGLVPDWLPPPQPYNVNLYGVVTVSVPFNQNYWSKGIFPRTPVLDQQPLNINLFTNPIPFSQFDWAKPVWPIPPRVPPPPLNINLFTNPIPFNQIDWSKGLFPHWLPQPALGINPNIFTNPFPFNPTDAPTQFRAPNVLAPAQPYNLSLYSITVTALPFNQTDWAVPYRSRPALDPNQQFNPNLFTNPFPFNQSDFAIPRRTPFAPPDRSMSLNLNLPAPFIQMPFSQYDWSPAHNLPPRIDMPLQNFALLVSVAPSAPGQPHNLQFHVTVGRLKSF